MSDSQTKTATQPLRLCSEIQLFDLCDLETCRFKSGRFCTDVKLLASFEKIAEEDQRAPERYISEETEYEDEYEDRDGFDLDEDNEGEGYGLNLEEE